MTSALFRWFIAGIALIAATVGASSARADLPTIEKGREADVIGLLAPYSLGGEVAGGWSLWDISIEQTQIEIGLRSSNQQATSLVLVHPTQASAKAMRTPSFALARDVQDLPSAQGARDALLQAIRNNDDGKFWRVTRPLNPGPGREQPFLSARALLTDGFFLSILGTLLSVALTLHVLRTAPKFVRVALPFVVVLGAGLRWFLSPASFLGAWPWSRIWPNVGTIWTSSLFGGFAAALGEEVYFTDLMLWVNFAYACLMPLVLFAHASQLLRDTRAGLAAATIVAFSPHHIRFSRCEDAFIPSLVLTSLAFALIHTFMRDGSRLWRWIALSALPFALWAGYLLRPLNILFVVVYLAAVLLLHPEHSPMRRRIVVGLVIGGVWAAAFVEFLGLHREQVADAAMNTEWLLRVPLTLIWPPWNMLIHPLVTPPALLLLAFLGVRWLRERKETRLAVFLVGWLAMFFIAHGYVVSAPMQPRYHLHLLVPFTLLASTAVVEAYRRSRRGFVVAAISIAIAPWLGKGWIQDVGYSDVREYAFVKEARDIIPEGCTVLEYVSNEPERDHDSRFKRISNRLIDKTYGERFSTVMARTSIDEGTATLDPLSRELLSRDSNACVYIYEGLNCWGQKSQEEAYAPTCSALLQSAPLETVMEERIPFRPYDDNVTQGVSRGTTQLRLALHRVVPRSGVAEVR